MLVRAKERGAGMDEATRVELVQGLRQLRAETGTKESDLRTDKVVARAGEVLDVLMDKPYLAAKQVAARCGIGRDELGEVYKLLQRSELCQGAFMHSRNRDYFNVVSHYFNHRMYTLVFFVGHSCPSRCIYCPNVTVEEDGRRRLASYGGDGRPALDHELLARIFEDLEVIRSAGAKILVKISGGLEPLTDIATVSAVVRHTRARDFRVKLFTNGLLLSDPAVRATALQADDVRISLCTPDEAEYREICFANEGSGQVNPLAGLKASIAELVAERSRSDHHCKIGFNSIVIPSNHSKLLALVELAQELGVDYVDFKPDYFSTYPADVVRQMEASTREAISVVEQRGDPTLAVNFTDSLFRDDLYWGAWDGVCDAVKQSRFKLFITPFGDCSPVHYGAFPHPTEPQSLRRTASTFCIGELNRHTSLLDLLRAPLEIPEIPMKRLNPFELMLSLELSREEEDVAWGLPISLSPYHTCQKDQLPSGFFG
jgi:pyruvate-formate lyase-activating enzyme